MIRTALTCLILSAGAAAQAQTLRRFHHGVACFPRPRGADLDFLEFAMHGV